MVKIALYNDSGKLITKSDLKLSDASFGKQYPDGRIIVNWSGENNDHDGNGFDKHHLEDNGEHTNSGGVHMALNSEVILRKALESVLLSRFSVDQFCLEGYQECATCLEYEANKWLIYNAERGNRYDLVVCDTLLEACIRFFRMMTHNHAEIANMENEFIQSIQGAA